MTKESKEDLVKSFLEDDNIQFFWCMLDVDISSHKDSVVLLHEIIEEYITVRGFAMTSSWLEQYKKAQNKSVSKGKGLRKELNR